MAPPALAPGVALSEHLSYGQRTKQPFFYRSLERGPTPALGQRAARTRTRAGLLAKFCEQEKSPGRLKLWCLARWSKVFWTKS
jgi:hypothetical protein